MDIYIDRYQSIYDQEQSDVQEELGLQLQLVEQNEIACTDNYKFKNVDEGLNF